MSLLHQEDLPQREERLRKSFFVLLCGLTIPQGRLHREKKDKGRLREKKENVLNQNYLLIKHTKNFFLDHAQANIINNGNFFCSIPAENMKTYHSIIIYKSTTHPTELSQICHIYTYLMTEYSQERYQLIHNVEG